MPLQCSHIQIQVPHFRLSFHGSDFYVRKFSFLTSEPVCTFTFSLLIGLERHFPQHKKGMKFSNFLGRFIFRDPAFGM